MSKTRETPTAVTEKDFPFAAQENKIIVRRIDNGKTKAGLIIVAGEKDKNPYGIIMSVGKKIEGYKVGETILINGGAELLYDNDVYLCSSIHDINGTVDTKLYEGITDL